MCVCTGVCVCSFRILVCVTVHVCVCVYYATCLLFAIGCMTMRHSPLDRVRVDMGACVFITCVLASVWVLLFEYTCFACCFPRAFITLTAVILMNSDGTLRYYSHRFARVLDTILW
jgi:hypothetical protein